MSKSCPALPCAGCGAVRQASNTASPELAAAIPPSQVAPTRVDGWVGLPAAFKSRAKVPSGRDQKATMPDWISTGAVFSPSAAGATRRQSGLPAAGPAGAFSRKGPLERPSGWVRSRVAPLFTPQRARPASLHVSPVTSQRFGNASHVKPLTATDALNNRIDRQLKGRHVRADGSNARAGHRAPSRRGPHRSPPSKRRCASSL